MCFYDDNAENQNAGYGGQYEYLVLLPNKK
jgi:hypothetical protein